MRFKRKIWKNNGNGQLLMTIPSCLDLEPGKLFSVDIKPLKKKRK